MSLRAAGERPPVPDSVRGAFSVPEMETLEAYVAWLADAGVIRGLIGPREAPRLWRRHIVNSALAAALLPEGGSVCDVGSGAGLPGIVLAILRPELSFTLLEPLLRRTTFLEEVVADLGLDNVEVLRGRAEEFHGERAFDVVCSRAVAPLDRLTRWCLPLTRPMGRVIALKGATIIAEVAQHRATLTSLGAGDAVVTELAAPEGMDGTFVVTIPWAEPSRVPLSSDRTAPSSDRSRSSNQGKSRRSE